MDADLMRLVSDKSAALRQKSQQLWNAAGKTEISNSEWHVLMRIYGRRPTISEVARAADISRQATHKCIKSLREKGVLDIRAHPHNRRCKYVELTGLGEKCYRENRLMKQQLEERIAGNIGPENVRLLKELLQKDWLLDPE